MLEIEADPQVVRGSCDHCGTPMTRVTMYLRRDDDAHAVCYASCYDHDGHEVWLDVILSRTWGDDEDDRRDRVTFGCRIGRVVGQDGPAATVVAAASAWPDHGLFGRKLTREGALAHPWLDDFWDVVDHVWVNNPEVSTHLHALGH